MCDLAASYQIARDDFGPKNQRGGAGTCGVFGRKSNRPTLASPSSVVVLAVRHQREDETTESQVGALNGSKTTTCGCRAWLHLSTRQGSVAVHRRVLPA